jgi:hypothetical protein
MQLAYIVSHAQCSLHNHRIAQQNVFTQISIIFSCCEISEWGAMKKMIMLSSIKMSCHNSSLQLETCGVHHIALCHRILKEALSFAKSFYSLIE